jgi:class 3 adenylate cyclase
MPDSRRIATVLFFDVVGSTQVAAHLGDARYRELLSRFYRIVTRNLKRFGGKEEDRAGDGFFATFPQPLQGIRCAGALIREVRELGIEIRVGMHTGECETLGGKTKGMAVVIGARVMSLGGAGELLVTNTTRELVTGGDLSFEDFSAHELKGVPGTWQVWAVTALDGTEVGRPLRGEEAAERLEQIKPVATVRRQGRRAGIIAAALAVGLVPIVWLASRSEEGGSPATSPKASPTPVLLRVDAVAYEMTSRVADEYQSLHMPGALWFDGSTLWQATATELVRRDPSTGEAVEVHPIDAWSRIELAFGSAWILHPGSGHTALERLDLVSGDDQAELDLPGDAADIRAGPNSLWYLSESGDLVEIDPIGTKILHRHQVDAFAPGLVVPLLGDVWICDCIVGKVLRFDPGKGEVVDTYELPEGGYLIGVDSTDETTLWVLNERSNTLSQLDPDTKELGDPIGVGGIIYDAEIAFGAIWVASGSELTRVDMQTRDRHPPIPMPEGVSAGGLAVDEAGGTLWIENCGCPTE